MEQPARNDYETLLAYWDSVFAPEADGAASPEEGEWEKSWQQLAPSPKLLQAALSLGACRHVLDYGSGSGWAGVLMAKGGCPHVTCADPAPHAQRLAAACAAHYRAAEQVQPVCITDTWLSRVPAGTYDGFFCSNVLDVIPPEMAESVLRHAARILAPGGRAVIGLNYWMPPEAAAARGFDLLEDGRVYLDGVLRLVSRTDEAWSALLARYFHVEKLDHFAWPGEIKETRRLFFLQAGEK